VRCAEILGDAAPVASRELSTIDMLPLVRVTAFYPDEETPQRGRGILFSARGRHPRARRALQHEHLSNREGLYSESWIYGGSADRDAVHLSEDDLGALMDRDRQLLCGRSVRSVARLVHRWRAALPHYDLQLESVAGARPRPAEGRLPRGQLRRGHRRADAARTGR
jgi:hypothetical protein